MRVESAPGQGSTFTVRCPLGRDHLPADRVGRARALASTAMGAGAFVEEALRWLPGDAGGDEPRRGLADRPLGAGARNRPRVLLADDNADMRDYMRRLLAERYEVAAVADGAAALAAAPRRPPDLVLADVMMPGLDGFGLLRELRADAATQRDPGDPAFGARGRGGRASRGWRPGADDYLVKPFTARDFGARGRAWKLSRVRAESALGKRSYTSGRANCGGGRKRPTGDKDQFLATLARTAATPWRRFPTPSSSMKSCTA